MSEQLAVRSTLEEGLTLDRLWDLFLMACPPPQEFTRADADHYKWFFASGLGCLCVILPRLERESPERRAAILASLEKQCVEATGVSLNG